jgi:3-oxocholest-4-en-26-oyl-CoA dehydrogenase alpha subunit
MRIAYTAEQERLRRELRGYFGELMTPSVRAALAGGDGDYGDGEAYRSVVRQLGRDGWLALGWPQEYGGRGGTMIDQLIFTDEAAVARVPVPFLTINTVGPTIMRFGSASQKAYFLPRIAAGEIHFSIGYSEPEAGTDLASLRTTAVRDGDEYVIDGQKMWTSLIQHADYVWLACRTDPSAERHRGLSIIIVPVTAAGFSWTPVPTVAGVTTSATYYSSVRVPVSALVGSENQGWPLITNQLNHERVALTSAAPVQSALADVREWASATVLPSGERVIDAEWVRLNLARVHAKAEFLKLLNWRVAAGGTVGPADASMTKVFGTEFAVEAYRLLMEVLGASAVVRSGSAGEVLAGRIERAHRAALILTFGGGTNEVQRDIIAAAALGLPFSRRLSEAVVDFTLSEEQAELGGLARKILAERDQPWGDLAAAGVLAAGLPASLDGAGLGLLEQCSVLVEVGRAVADVPYLASVVVGAGAVAEFGTAAQRSRWARPAGRGSVVLTAALAEEDGDDPGRPSATAVRRPGGSWVLSGVKTAVDYAPQADVFLVPCASAEGVLVFLVSPSDAGVTVEAQALTSFAPAGRLVLDSAALGDDRVLGAGSDVAGWLVGRATVGLCAMQVGVLERALELTAEHARTRVQFGRPIGAFQAVAQRLADAAVDVEAVRLTMWQAAWLLSAGLPAEVEVATAKFWAADAGHRVAHTAVHVHGGLGIDVSYPVHRYFVAAKGNEFALGGATAQLRRIGAVLAES